MLLDGRLVCNRNSEVCPEISSIHKNLSFTSDFESCCTREPCAHP